MGLKPALMQTKTLQKDTNPNGLKPILMQTKTLEKDTNPDGTQTRSEAD